MKQNNSYRYRASSSSIKLNVLTCSKTPTPPPQQNPRLWMRKSKRRQQIKILTLLAVLKNWMGQQQKKKKRLKDQNYKENNKSTDFDWINLVQAGYHIGVIYKTILIKVQKRVTRARSLGQQFPNAKKHSQKLHISRLALANFLIPDEDNRQFMQMRSQSLKIAKLFSINQPLSIKNIFDCICQKTSILLASYFNLTVLNGNKSSLSHMRLAAQGFRSLVIFFNNHLNSVMVSHLLDQPEWDVFQIVNQYDKKYRNNDAISDDNIVPFFRQSFKIAVDLYDRYFHCPTYRKPVSTSSFKQFLQITISLRYDLCYLERFLQLFKQQKQKSLSITTAPYTNTIDYEQDFSEIGRKTTLSKVQDMMKKKYYRSSSKQNNSSSTKFRKDLKSKCKPQLKVIKKRIYYEGYNG